MEKISIKIVSAIDADSLTINQPQQDSDTAVSHWPNPPNILAAAETVQCSGVVARWHYAAGGWGARLGSCARSGPTAWSVRVFIRQTPLRVY